MVGKYHHICWLISFIVVWFIITYRSKKTEKKIKNIVKDPKMKFWGNAVGGCYFISYIILIFYSLNILSLEHNGFLLLYRIAICGTIISCITEIVMIIVSKRLRIPINTIILAVADESKTAPFFIRFFRIIGPMLLLISGAVFICTKLR